jgi:hypothetical protein
MPRQSNQSGVPANYALTLEENAEDSVLHAFEHLSDRAQSRDLKFAVLHALHGLELIIKAFLAKQHPLLIYRNPEDGDDSFTVELDSAIRRSVKCGLVFDQNQLRLIQEAKKIRNQIEHASFSINKQRVEVILFEVLEVILEVMDSEFGKSRDELVRGSRGWLDLLERARSFDERVAEAERRAHDKLPDPRDGGNGEVVQCDECGVDAVALPSENEYAVCENCGSHHEYFECSSCGCLVLGQLAEESPDMCDGCIDNRMHADD